MATVYTNQPAGSSLFYNCSLSGTICGMSSFYNTFPYATITGPEGGSVQVLNPKLSVGSTEGNGEWGLSLPSLRDVYFATWWKTNSTFVGMCNNTNKMFFFRNPSIDNSFLQWYGTPGETNSKQFSWANQTTYSNASNPHWVGDASGLSGSFYPNVNASVANVLPNSGWHFLEMYLKTSTTTSSRDGVVMIWVDRVLSTNNSSINQSPGGFTAFSITHTWDGSFCLQARDKTKEWSHYFYDMRIATGGSVTTTPPPQIVLQSLTPANASTTVGGTRQFTISMSGAMPSATSLFTNSSVPTVATVPASVTISQGSSTAVLTATGVAAGATTISTSYNGVTKAAALQVQAAPTTGATTTYTYATDFSGTQGPNWYYLEEGGTQMTYNGGGSVWVGSDAFLIQTIWSSGFHPGRFAGAKVRFVCPNAGSARITGAYYDTDTGGGVGVVAKVNHNGSTLFQRSIANGETTGGAYDVTATVAAGDFIEFLVINQTSDYSYNSTNLDPVIELSVSTGTPGGGTPPDPPASVVDLFTTSTTITKDIPFTLTVRLSKTVTVDTAVEIRVGSISLVTVASSVTVLAGTNEKSFTVTPIQVGNVAIDAILTTTARYTASIQPNPADVPPVEEPEIPPITTEHPLLVQAITLSQDGAVVTLNRAAKALAFRYDAQPGWTVVLAFEPGGLTYTHTFTWPSGTTMVSYRAQDGEGTWGPHADGVITPPQPPPPGPPANKAIIDKAGIRWQLTGKKSPYTLKRNGTTVDHTFGVTLRKTGDGYMEILQTNGVWLRRNGDAWEFVE